MASVDHGIVKFGMAKDDDRAADVPEAFVGEDVEATPMTADRMDEFI